MSSKGVGRAIAKRVDSTGLPALYDILSTRGFGSQQRILVRYVGHAGAHGALVHDPDAVPTPEAVWLRADRFNVQLVAKLEPDLASLVPIVTIT